MKTDRLRLTARIWFIANLLFDGCLVVFMFLNPIIGTMIILPGVFASAFGSLPIMFMLFLLIPFFNRKSASPESFFWNLFMICVGSTVLYGMAGAFGFGLTSFRSTDFWTEYIKTAAIITGILSAISFLSLLISNKSLHYYFVEHKSLQLPNQHTYMETANVYESRFSGNQPGRSNKILTKGIITAVLIGVMMIPTIFISNLVQERQARQESVVKEVNSRWAASQTLTGPYIYLPYTVITKDASNKLVETGEHLLIIPDDKRVAGKIDHELRLRSIYKVLLYHASLSDQGNFLFQLPKDISPELVHWKDARICFGITDFKGIEERMIVHFNGAEYELSPGLPDNEINEKGLSAPISFTAGEMGKPIPYSINIKIKGSEMLHFVPLSGNSEFVLTSTWPSPSFDGNNIPSERKVTDSGFTAKWIFNKANLPFGTVLDHFKIDEDALAFGVTMVQPADQYAKTNRSVKYAILIIGLTFSLFFIIELMQKKPIHPVQYVLIGLGLVIFYSLLLAISEFLDFDYAYLIASISTILLIALYARGHFRSWKSAGIFGGILTLLYGFIFVLIRLEDTALLVGSIGLFIILAITMYASKKVNWYGEESVGSVESVVG
jgi:inner membrane protein